MGLVGHTPARFAAAGHAAAPSRLPTEMKPLDETPAMKCAGRSIHRPDECLVRESAQAPVDPPDAAVLDSPAMRGARLGRDCVAAV